MRYSLRTLVLLVTLIASLLGIWTSRASHQRRTVARIQSLGGDVEYAPSKFPLMEKCLGKDFVASVVAVQMYRLDSENIHYVVDEAAFVDCLREIPSVNRVEGLFNHQEWRDRLRRRLPDVDVIIYRGGVI